MYPEGGIDPFNVPKWLKVFRYNSFKFVWGVHGGPNWFRQLDGNSVQIVDKSSKCAELGVLKLFETQIRTGPGASRMILPSKCPARQESNRDHSHDVRSNFEHVKYLILRHRLLVVVAIRSGDSIEPSTILDQFIATDPDFQ